MEELITTFKQGLLQNQGHLESVICYVLAINEEFNSEENPEERVPALTKEEIVAIGLTELFEPSWGTTVELNGVLGDSKVFNSFIREDP